MHIIASIIAKILHFFLIFFNLISHFYLILFAIIIPIITLSSFNSCYTHLFCSYVGALSFTEFSTELFPPHVPKFSFVVPWCPSLQYLERTLSNSCYLLSLSSVCVGLGLCPYLMRGWTENCDLFCFLYQRRRIWDLFLFSMLYFSSAITTLSQFP